MTTSTEACFPFDDITDRVTLAFHGPYHGNWDFVRWHSGDWNDFPMFTINVVLKFLMHGCDELGPIRLLKSFMEKHGIRIREPRKETI